MNRDLIETIEIYLCAVVNMDYKIFCYLYKENLFFRVIIITRLGILKVGLRYMLWK